MTVLDLQNGGYVELAPGAAAAIGAGPAATGFTIMVTYKRDAANTNSRQDMVLFSEAGFESLIVDLQNSGGLEAFVNGFQQATHGTNPTDDVWFTGVLKGTFAGGGSGSADVTINVKNQSTGTWAGWVAAGSIDGTGSVYDLIQLGAPTSDFPYAGRLAESAFWDGELADAVVTDEDTGLGVSAAATAALNPIGHVRPGMSNPIVADAGGLNETGRTGFTGDPLVEGDDPYDLSLGGGPEPVTGTLGGSLPALTGALTGSAASTGTIGGNLPAVTGSLTAAATASATVSGSLPAVTGSLTGPSTAAGSIGGQLPALAGTLTGQAASTGTVAGNLPALVGQLDGRAAAAATVGGDLPAITGSLAGAVGDVVGGTLGGSLPGMTGSLAGSAAAAGAFAGALPALAGLIAGEAGATGQLGGTLPALVGLLIETVPITDGAWPPLRSVTHAAPLRTTTIG